MRGAITISLGVTMVAAMGISCGPPPAEMRGKIIYSFGCRNDPMTGATCFGGTAVYEGGVGSGSPPLVLGCTVQRLNDGRTRLRFNIGRGMSAADTTLSQTIGMSVCGEVAGPMMEMNNGLVDLYFYGPASFRNSLPGTCRVFINTLGRDAFSGRIQCTDARDNDSPARLRFISGIAGMTSDPEWGDFEFTTCREGLVSCR